MLKTLKKILFICACIPLLGLTCETTPPVNDLNTPMGLKCTIVTGNTTYSDWYTNVVEALAWDADDDCTGANIRIGFYAFNSETGLSGYNVYMVPNATCTGTTQEIWDCMQGIVNDHILDGTFTSSSDDYIISRTSGTNGIYPTIDDATVRTKVTSNMRLVPFDFDYGVSTYDNGPFPFTQDGLEAAPSGTYKVGVTAVNIGDVVESKISNIISITF